MNSRTIFIIPFALWYYTGEGMFGSETESTLKDAM